MSEAMVYLTADPHPLLRSCVRILWYCRAPHIAHHRERVLPNGCMQIILNLARNYLTDCGEDGKANGRLPPAIVVGPRARHEVVDTADMEELVGICFQPGGFAELFRERADLFFGRSIALDDVWVGARLAERLSEVPTPLEKLRTLEVLLTQFFHQGTRRSELVEHALHLFRDRALSVAQCAGSVGVSERRLSQVFREQVGMSPKMWCRIRRFQTAVRDLHNGVDVPWAELALRCGYYDQSHFANDFRAFSGINPTTYSAGRGPWQNHVPILSSEFSKHCGAFGGRVTDMTSLAKNCRSTVIPGLRYRNAITMIEWLCRAFGFEKQAVYAGPDGLVMHSQLTLGNGMIMVGSVNNGSPASNLLKQPDEIGGAETQTPYLVVSDIDAIYASAKMAGAKMVIDLEAKDHGGKAFSCSDPEGHVWHVGTFDPWESQ